MVLKPSSKVLGLGFVRSAAGLYKKTWSQVWAPHFQDLIPWFWNQAPQFLVWASSLRMRLRAQTGLARYVHIRHNAGSTTNDKS